ncbi:MAG TPA: YIP1 family protein [Bacteroidales bacterium]|nr:YIP1 family protein [Bacteroidales bacterium]
MDFRFLYHRTKYFIISPVKAWEVVHRENRPIKYVRGSFFMPLIILVSVSSFFGSLFFINNTLEPMYSVLVAINVFLFLYLCIYASSYIVTEITKALDLGRNFEISFKLVVYSLAPLFLSLTISRLFESMLFINILSLYGLYIFWTGMEKMVNPPEHKKLPMVIATVISMVIIIGILQIVLSKVTETIYFAFFA